jgi:hypothetical protein
MKGTENFNFLFKRTNDAERERERETTACLTIILFEHSLLVDYVFEISNLILVRVRL